MKSVSVVLGILMVAVCAFAYHQWQAANSLAAKVDALEAKLTTRPQPTLAVQVQCADHARKAFQEMGYKPTDIAGYENHYSAKFNKCFMVTSYTMPSGKEIAIAINLNDALEGREYGAYAWRSQANKQAWDVKPWMCHVLMPSGSKQSCTSQEEFEQLANTYMRD